MRVVTGGDVAAVYINDRQVARFQGSPPKGGSHIGLRAASGSEPYTWAFSELRIRRGPDATVAAAPQSQPQPQRLPDEIVAAWEDEGATFGWMRISEFGVPQLKTDTGPNKGGAPGDLPAFLLRTGEVGSLPPPPASFGLQIFSPAADLGLKNLAGFKNLQVLGLFCVHVTDAGLKGLAELNSLQTLLLACPQLTDEGLNELASLTEMQALTITCPQATDATLGAIAPMSKLRILNITGAQVTDAGLKHLAGMNDLQRLNLDNNKMLTDAGLTALSGLKKLKALDLRRTGVTDAGVQTLRQALPDCVITQY
jgi:hypothetical protein